MRLLRFLAYDEVERQRDYWRDKCEKLEQRLLDVSLKRQGAEPLTQQPPRPLELAPDPPPTPIDEAIRDDDILQDIEYAFPELKGLTPSQVRAQHPTVWRQAEENYNRQHAPLRAE